MGWKGTLRTIDAEMRRSERAAVKKHRELERRLDIMDVAQQVALHENYIERITSLHVDATPRVNWESLHEQSAPTCPTKDDVNERQAIGRLEDFRPTVFQKFIGTKDRLRRKMEKRIDEGRLEDDEYHRKALLKYDEQFSDWKQQNQLAEGILLNEPNAYREAVEDFFSISEISEIGSSVSIQGDPSGIMLVEIDVHGNEIIPSEALSQLKSGKLSIKSMPRSRFNEIYQDYVCSSVLRMGREMVNILPLERVIISAVDQLVDRSTGHLSRQAIVSVVISKFTVDQIKFEGIDPSDALINFVHNMDFRKTTGFEPIEMILPNHFD